MEALLFEPSEFARLYNCSWYSVEAVPLEARRNPRLGAGLIALATFYTLCYAPCVVAIGRHLEHSCYKIMYVLGWCDLVALLNGCLLGYFAIQGMVFCSQPALMLFNCNLSFTLWLLETSLATLLAADRCVELLNHKMGVTLFEGWHTWCWIAMPIGYALFAMIFVYRGCSFSGILFSYANNVHAGYYDEWYKDPEYHSNFYAVHNLAVGVALAVLYSLMLVGLKWKSWRAHAVIAPVLQAADTNQASNAAPTVGGWQHQIYLQVAAICAANFGVIVLFMSFHYMAVPPWLIYVATFCLLSAHGLPGVVYLTLNATLRHDCRMMLGKACMTAAMNLLPRHQTTIAQQGGTIAASRGGQYHNASIRNK